MVTPDEKKRTEKDVTFDLTSAGAVQFYFGRELIGEKINELLGREMTEKEIENNANPFTIDNLLCTTCEKKLGRLESLYAKLIVPKITQLNNGMHTSVELEEAESLLLKAFLYSIIWRLGESKYNSYEIHASILNKLSTILKHILALEETEIVANIKKHKDLINAHKIGISYFDNTANPETRFVFYTKDKTKPHCYFINGISVFFYYKIEVLHKKGNSFLGLEKLIDRKTILEKDSVTITKSDKGTVIKAVHEMATIIAKEKLKFYRTSFQEAYLKRKGKMPDVMTLSAFISELVSDNYTHADKYSAGRIVNLARKYCA